MSAPALMSTSISVVYFPLLHTTPPCSNYSGETATLKQETRFFVPSLLVVRMRQKAPLIRENNFGRDTLLVNTGKKIKWTMNDSLSNIKTVCLAFKRLQPLLSLISATLFPDTNYKKGFSEIVNSEECSTSNYPVVKDT